MIAHVDDEIGLRGIGRRAIAFANQIGRHELCILAEFDPALEPRIARLDDEGLPRGHRKLREARDARVERCGAARSEEPTSELQSLMRTSYAVFCLKNKK